MSEERRELALRLLAARRQSAAPAGGGLPRAPRDGRPLVCSAEQRRVWLAELVAGPGATPPVTLGLAVDGPLDTARLTAALASVVGRHPVLRTRFAARDDVEPWQTPPAAPPTAAEAGELVEVLDLAPFPEAEREDLAAGMAVDAAGQPFDPAAGRLLRLTVLRLAPDRHRLLLACHHIAADGPSMAVLLDQLATAYRDDPSPAAPEAPDYADYAQWSRERLERILPGRLAYWRHQLTGAPDRLSPALAPPARRPRPGGRSTATATARVDADTLRALREAGPGPAPLTPHVVLLTAFLVLLARAAGTREATVGVVSGGRPHPELAATVGCFTDLLPVRVKLQGDPDYRTLAPRVRDTLAAALANATPFDQIVSALSPRRLPGVHPVFQALFIEREDNGRDTPGDWGGGLTVRPWGQEVDGTAYDLTLAATTGADGAELVLTYPRERFSAAAAGAFVSELTELLEQLAAQPDEPVGKSVTAEAWRPDPSAVPKAPAAPAPAPVPVGDGSLVAEVRALWADVLGRPEVGADDDLFTLGADSLAVVRIAARTQERYGVPVPAALFFTTPTPAAFGAALAQLVEEHRHG
ncbi:hypothetical protein SRB5_08500 [Streptomyces sp. RB5]|uniref:Carrier domain-containing protein n=1 Tax=Streptomyces smaragdinus TaxID=2585196 RepID=A0A7K0CBA2_9ACTN|nr:condensation domain-containing protein [Streptomyces smaragdinus]MQY10737.1 hypothetical protein [Streptomyces smaragdinus]